MSHRIQDAFEEALQAAAGVKVVTEDGASARSLRRKGYAVRDVARESGDARYDGLSMLLRGRELWLIKRELCQENAKVPQFSIAELNPCDIPRGIRVRGKARLGIRQMLAVLNELVL